jgi:hypothetical protein
MALSRGFSNSFNAGELAEEAWARTDLQQHAKGCAMAQNFVGLVAGPLARRGGFWDVGAIADQDRVGALVPFKRTADQALMLEFGHNLVRVWQADGAPLMSGSDQVEFSSPFGEAQLPGLRWHQDGDLMVFTHEDPSVRTQSLVRSSSTTFTFADWDFRNGPWRNENVTTTTVTVTGTMTPGGAVTIASSSAVFEPGHEGALFAFRQNDGNPDRVPTWVSDTDFDEAIYTGALARCVSNGRVYSYATPPDGVTKFGTTQPIHTSGTVNDGHIPWTYVHDGRGIVRITEVYSATSAAGVVVTQMPYASAVATKYWSEGAYSDYRGFPTAWPTIREERLILAGTDGDPDIVDGSQTAGYGISGTSGYADFKPGLGTGRVVDDDALRRRVGEDGGRIVWLKSSANLIVGTVSGEHVLTGATLDDPLVPASKPRPIGKFGVADVGPADAHTSILFVAANRQTLRGVALAPDQGLVSEDMSVVASHIGARGLAQLAWTKQPDNICWARLDDGGLAAFLYHAEQNVKGWYRQQVGDGSWTVESIAVIPGANARDALWLIAKRTKSGSAQRRIMMLSDRVADKLRLDAAELYEGAAVGGVSGAGSPFRRDRAWRFGLQRRRRELRPVSGQRRRRRRGRSAGRGDRNARSSSARPSPRGSKACRWIWAARAPRRAASSGWPRGW